MARRIEAARPGPIVRMAPTNKAGVELALPGESSSPPPETPEVLLRSTPQTPRLKRSSGRAPNGHRVICGRAYSKHPLEEIVAQMAGWIIVLVPEWSRDGWLSFKVFRVAKRLPPRSKRLWQIATKDGKPSGSGFAKNLEATHPRVYKWAIAEMRKVAPPPRFSELAGGGKDNGR